jgi:uncharacterized protein YjbJ (UPF0337 family)
MTTDQVYGRIEIAMGKAKKLAGAALHNSRLKHSGLRTEVVGQARAMYGDAMASVIRRLNLR